MYATGTPELSVKRQFRKSPTRSFNGNANVEFARKPPSPVPACKWFSFYLQGRIEGISSTTSKVWCVTSALHMLILNSDLRKHAGLSHSPGPYKLC
eukprot:jgi/Botrbrau1/3760/Bobra.0363s0037.1